MNRKAAILGLGQRGLAWAEMFREAGWRVSGFDPDAGATGLPKGSRGWKREQTISATAAQADWVICCLPDRLELMQKVIQRAQAEAPQNAVIAVNSRSHDIEAVQGCAMRPSQIVLLTGDTGHGIGLNVTSRNPPALKIDAMATLSEVCPDPVLTLPEDTGRDQSRDTRSA